MGLREFCAHHGTPYQLPKTAGTYSGNLVVCGDAACLWIDLERFGCRDDSGQGKVAKPGWDFMTVNGAIERFPGNVEHCYSNQPGVLRRFIASRRDEYTAEFGGSKHQHAICNCQNAWPFGGHGTSGLGACLVAVGLGYSRIVLCGMPLDDGPHNGEPHWRRTAFASSEAAGSVNADKNRHWETAKSLAFEGKVKSMSGRTRTWLGDAMEWA